MKGLKSLLLFSTLIVLAASCKKDPPEEPPVDNSYPAGTLNLGSDVNSDFFGMVKDEMGLAVVGADVTIGDKTTTTDVNGVFKINQATTPSKLSYVKVEKDGYFIGARSVLPAAGVYNYIDITLIEKGSPTTYTSGATETVVVTPGVSVEMPARYQDLVGNDYHGTVKVFAKFISSEALDIDQALGSNYGQGADGVERYFENYGTLLIELEGNSGQKIKIAPGETANIHMRIEQSQLANAPIGIPMVYFDSKNGYHVEDGSGSFNIDEFVGEVSHIDYWSFASAYSVAQTEGTLTNYLGDSLSNFALEINLPNGDGQFHTNSNGTFSAYVPANLGFSFKTIDDCGIANEIQATGPYGTGMTVSEMVSIPNGLVQLVQEKGTLLDCDLLPITDGYVIVTIGGVPYPSYVSDGNFMVDNINCQGASLVELVGYDMGTDEISVVAQKNINAPINDMGSVVACNSFTEHISFSIDQGTPYQYFTDIFCGRLDTGGGWFFEIYPVDQSINIKSSVFTPGQYTYYANVQPNTVWVQPADMNEFAAFSIGTELINWAEPGQYVRLAFSGVYTDVLLVNHSLQGDLVVYRDL